MDHICLYNISHLYCSLGQLETHEASEKLKLCKLLAKKNQRLGLEREKGDRGANRYGSLPIMGGLGLQHLACSIQNRILLPYTGV